VLTTKLCTTGQLSSLKRTLVGPFSGDAILLLQPSLDHAGPVLCFPFFQSFVIPPLGFDHLTSIRIFIGFEFAWFACSGGRSRRLASGRGLRVEQVNDVL